ncbi:TetR/AcrR family transcriptional regulator [Nocardioides dilutus]
MPKIVDHEERRREVLDATWRVIGREGLNAATVRRIAEEAGHSNGVLAHYFNNKNDILVSAHQLAYSRARARIAKATADVEGLEALRRAIHEALPLDEERLLEAQVDVSFLGLTVGDAHLREVRSASGEISRARWRSYVERAQELGEVDVSVNPDDVVDDVIALIESLSIGAIITPERVTVAHQLAQTERLISRITRHDQQAG